MQRFIDRRTSALMRGLSQGAGRSWAASAPDGAVTVEGHLVGRLAGFHFEAERGATALENRALRGAAERAVAPEVARRLGALAAESDEAFALDARRRRELARRGGRRARRRRAVRAAGAADRRVRRRAAARARRPAARGFRRRRGGAASCRAQASQGSDRGRPAQGARARPRLPARRAVRRAGSAGGRSATSGS